MEALLTPMNIAATISAILGLIIGAGTIGMKLRAVILEIREAVDAYKSAVHPDGDGGTEITDAEKAVIAERTVDVVETAVEEYGTSVVGKLLGLNK